MKNLQKLLRIGLLLLAIPLAGAKAEDIVGCGGCAGSGPEDKTTDPAGELPGGGGVAASKTYSIDRSEMGMSTETLTSESTYTMSGTLGHYLSQGRTLSDKYLVHHPMSKNIITESTEPAELQVEPQEEPQ